MLRRHSDRPRRQNENTCPRSHTLPRGSGTARTTERIRPQAPSPLHSFRLCATGIAPPRQGRNAPASTRIPSREPRLRNYETEPEIGPTSNGTAAYRLPSHRQSDHPPMSIRDEGNIRFARTRPRQEQEPPILRDGFVPGSTTALASDDNGFRHSAPGRSTRQNRISPASPALRSETTSLFPARPRRQEAPSASLRPSRPVEGAARNNAFPTDRYRLRPPTASPPGQPALPPIASAQNARRLAGPRWETAASSLALSGKTPPCGPHPPRSRPIGKRHAPPTRTSPKKTQRHERRERFAFLRPASEDRPKRFCKIFSRNRPDLFAANYFLLIFVPAIRNGSVA